MAEDTLSIADIAQMAGVSKSRVSAWIGRGMLPGPLPPDAPAPYGCRQRGYRFSRQAVVEALAKIRLAKEILRGGQYRNKPDQAEEPAIQHE
jgi:hypothetical protein